MSVQDDLETRFTRAVAASKGLPPQSPPVQLELYGLFKQAKEGDAMGSRPGMFDMRGRAKYDAWAGHKGLSKADAMGLYIAVIERLSGSPV